MSLRSAKRKNKQNLEDPDNKITYWYINDDDDYEYIKYIEDEGSIQLYLNAKEQQNDDVVNRLESVGFEITPAEEVIKVATNSELGDHPQNIFQTMLNMFFLDVTVVGKISKEHSDYLCLDTLYFNKPYSKYDLESWMGSMFDLANVEQSNCFLLAHFEYTVDDIRELVSDLFTDMEVVYNNKNIVIPLDELKLLYP
jgi:hypothetical protein